MKFNDAYKQYVTEASSCKRKRKKMVKEQCNEQPSINACQPNYGCEDDQNQMIVNNLIRIKDNSEYIAQYIQSTGGSEEWVQEKIAAVAREIDNIYHYAQGEQNKMQSSNCGGPSTMQSAMVIGDKPGAAPVGTYVFSTEKTQCKSKMSKKRKAGRIYY